VGLIKRYLIFGVRIVGWYTKRCWRSVWCGGIKREREEEW
jgi:hypothetical protein